MHFPTFFLYISIIYYFINILYLLSIITHKNTIVTAYLKLHNIILALETPHKIKYNSDKCVNMKDIKEKKVS